jgi:hypothetical protein
VDESQRGNLLPDIAPDQTGAPTYGSSVAKPISYSPDEGFPSYMQDSSTPAPYAVNSDTLLGANISDSGGDIISSGATSTSFSPTADFGGGTYGAEVAATPAIASAGGQALEGVPVPTESAVDFSSGAVPGAAESAVESGAADAAASGFGEMGMGGGVGAAMSGVTDLLSGNDVDVGRMATGAAAGMAGTAAGTWAAAELGAELGSAAGPAGTVIGAAVGSLVSVVGNSIGGRVICTELNRQGLLPDDVYALDQAYTRENLDEDVIRGYLIWARPIALKMKTSPALTRMVLPIASAWSYTMASRMQPGKYKPRALGKFLLWAGVPACRLIGRVLRKRELAVA